MATAMATSCTAAAKHPLLNARGRVQPWPCQVGHSTETGPQPFLVPTPRQRPEAKIIGHLAHLTGHELALWLSQAAL